MSNQTNFTSEQKTEIEVQEPSAGWTLSFDPSLVPGGSELMTIILMVFLGLGSFWLTRRPGRHQSDQTNSASMSVALMSTSTKPKLASATQWLGWAKDLEDVGHPAAASQAFEQGLQQHPQDFWLWYQHGLFLARQERFAEAIVSYDQATLLRPNHGELAHARGDTLLELERYTEAVTTLELALRYAPNSGHLLTDLAYALFKSGQYTEALAIIQKALSWQTSNGGRDLLRAYRYQIDCFISIGQPQAALAAAQAAHAAYPQEEFSEIADSLR
jgi:predicted Zn-dependent protease